MTLKEIKQLQEMGFSLEEIKNEYFTEAEENNDPEPGEVESVQGSDSEETPETKEVKKNFSTDSLKEEIKEIKNLMFKKYSSENKEDSKIIEESMEDIFNKIIN